MRIDMLFAGADAGHYKLPDAVRELRQAVAHCDTYTVPDDDQTDRVAHAVDRLHADVRIAALNGSPPPSLTPLIDAAGRREANAALIDAVRTTRTQLAAELDGLVIASADSIIVECLRPAFDDVLATVRKAAKRSDADLDRLAERYASIRAAQAILARASGGAQHDVGGRYAEFKNMNDLWPVRGTWLERKPPWPQGTRERMAWLVASEAEPWMPTLAEQDERWWAVHGEAVLARPGVDVLTLP